MQNSIYQEVTDQIISEIEKGAMPWVKPWKADSTSRKTLPAKKNITGSIA